MLKRHRPPLSELNPLRICLIKPSALGDIVHALPVLTGLRRRFPDSHISWVVNRSYESLLKGHPDLNETIPFDRSAAKKQGWWKTLLSFRRFLIELRHRRFDLVLDLQGLLKSGLMTRATGAPRRIGLSSAREGASWCYTDLLKGTGRLEGHAVDRYWTAAQALGASERDRIVRLPAFDSEAAWVEQTLQACPRPWLFVAVGSRWETKRWPPSFFGEILRRAQETRGGTVLFVGGSEDTAASLEATRVLRGPSLLLTGQTTIPQLAALLHRADVMVANDTGPLHLAAAMGRPVLAPYTCTKVALTGPYGQLHQAIETKVWCAGSLIKRCPRMECMSELTPERLWPTLREILLRWQSNSLSA